MFDIFPQPVSDSPTSVSVSTHTFIIEKDFILWIIKIVIQTPTEEHLSYFQFRSIMNKTVMNMHVLVFEGTYSAISLGTIP